MVKSYEALKVLVLDFSKIQFGPKCKFMYQKKIVWPGTFSQVWSIQFFIILELILQKRGSNIWLILSFILTLYLILK